MSLATLGSKFWSPIHDELAPREAAQAVQRPLHTQADRMAAGRALTRHAVLAALAMGSVAYGLLTALARV